MRTILLLILYILTAVISIPLYLVEFAVRCFSQKTAAKLAQIIVRAAFRLTMLVSGCRKTVIGIENIPKDTPVIYAANHRGFYDIILAYATVPNQTAFISKIEIKKLPCIAQWMYFLNCLFMDRGNVKQNLNVILQAVSLVKEGYSIYIAPEGTRNASDTLLEFKEGSMKIAVKTDCPVVPVCLYNTENILENHLPWVRGGNISIEFGEPIYPSELDKDTRKRLGAYVRDKIAVMYEEAGKRI